MSAEDTAPELLVDSDSGVDAGFDDGATEGLEVGAAGVEVGVSLDVSDVIPELVVSFEIFPGGVVGLAAFPVEDGFEV